MALALKHVLFYRQAHCITNMISSLFIILNLNINESTLRYGISELHWYEKFLHLSQILATILNVTIAWKKSIMYLLI